MEMKSLIFKNDFPEFWLSCPNIGSPIAIPGSEGVYFLPAKTLLPDDWQDFLHEKFTWTLNKMMKYIEERIPSKKEKLLIFVNAEESLTDPEFSKKFETSSILYIPFLVDAYTDVRADEFVARLDSYLLDPSFAKYETYVIVAGNNGVDNNGFLVCSYLIRKCKLSFNEAIEKFRKSKDPGIMSQTVLKGLSTLTSPPGALPKTLPIAKWARRNPEIGHHKSISLEKEDTPSLDYFGGRFVTDKVALTTLQQIIDNAMPPCVSQNKTLYTRDVKVWDDSMFAVFDKNVYRISFVPRGSQVFIVANDNKGIYVNYGYKKFWRFDAEVNFELPLVLSATAVDKGSRLHLFIDDLLLIGAHTFHTTDIDERIYHIYFRIIPKITITSKDIKLNYRPVGRVTNSARLYEKTRDFRHDYGFDVEGLVLLRHGDPSCKSIYLPQRQTLLLFFKMNTFTNALLYARADSGEELVPITMYNLNKHEDDGALDGYVVRFDFQDGHLMPLSVCKNEFPSTYTFAKSIIKFFEDKRSGLSVAVNWQSHAEARTGQKQKQ